VPIGFGMWLAHYSFHLFTSYGTILPAAQRFAEDQWVERTRRSAFPVRMLPEACRLDSTL